MLAGLRKNYLKHLGAKVLSVDGLRKVSKDPSLAYKHFKTLFLNRDFRNVTNNQNTILYRDSVAALARMAMPIDRADISFEDWLPFSPNGQDMSDLGTLFEAHGSDKASHHDYHRIYSSIFKGKREMPLNILEIGLGSNNLDVPSNMGLWGKPGASLRAFRDWAPRAHIFGADVDKRILFKEDRISTFWVDQTDRNSLIDLASRLHGTKFDLIIDDGLHLPHANFNTLETLLPLLADDGFCVVEDIEPVHKPFYQLAQAVLAMKYETYFTTAKGGCVFVVRASPTSALI